ncbi:SDR family NAD(P)-dependent oxidoreductase [Aureimonas leprariae]|uniref:SDR family NAD(P)-dependent oxidoreductase n=1 Tax=Plantimonas leprariae TaxID=2615207 RepID=A0A7V7PKK5_9HYPH|nr:SDR family NAD(P)-dependent oxidoreductase [Aureimonas leprariae]KAB0676442.1 SDR family NAD(P)-dependent oxidoreductase [Aureimonas leprariae]
MLLGSSSSADDVLRGRDLSGQRVLITGVSAGVGAATARAILDQGGTVLGAVRNIDKARIALGMSEGRQDFHRLELIELDLASLESVRSCAIELRRRAKPFDVMICNAGIMAVPEGSTVDGFETQLGTNYVGHFVLVNELHTLFAPAGRLVVLSSAGHRGADVGPGDLQPESGTYDPLTAYRRSKTALILMAVEFDRRHRHRGIRATAVHPGAVLTETAQKLVDAQPEAASRFSWKSPAQGAATSVWAAFVADADEIGGRYCEDCHVADVNDDPRSSEGVRSYAMDPKRAHELWEATESLTPAH